MLLKQGYLLMTNFWLSQWRASLALTAAALETSLAAQKTFADFAQSGRIGKFDENRMRDAFHSAADQNLRRWEDAAGALQNLPEWYRDLTRVPGGMMTDMFDKARRG